MVQSYNVSFVKKGVVEGATIAVVREVGVSNADPKSPKGDPQPASLIERYATGKAFVLGTRSVVVWWEESAHVFSLLTGRCVESAYGLMEGFRIRDADLPVLVALRDEAEEMASGQVAAPETAQPMREKIQVRGRVMTQFRPPIDIEIAGARVHAGAIVTVLVEDEREPAART